MEFNFEKELIANQTAMTKYARALTRNAAHAADLVQDANLRAWSKQHLFEPGTDFKAWLFTILRHQHVSQVRLTARKGKNEQELTPKIEIHAASPKTEQEIFARLELNDVRKAAKEISEDMRQVLQLITVDKMKYEEAAKILGVPTGTIRSRLSRGREALREAAGQQDRRGAPTGRGAAQDRVDDAREEKSAREAVQTPKAPQPSLPPAPGNQTGHRTAAPILASIESQSPAPTVGAAFEQSLRIRPPGRRGKKPPGLSNALY